MRPETRVRLDPLTRARLEYGCQLFNAERAQRYEPPLTLSQYIALVLGQVLPAPGPVSAQPTAYEPQGYAVGFGGEK